MLVLGGLVGFHKSTQVQLLQQLGWGIDLDYCDTEWFALETEIICHLLDCFHVLHFTLFC